MAWQDKCSSWRSRLAASRQDDVLNDAEFAVGVYGIPVRANRAILAMASPVMKALLYGPLSANNKTIIPINDGTARGFMAMIDFIYDEDKYSIKDLLDGKEEMTTSEDLAQVMELLYFADKYQIKSLISFCRNLLIHKIKLNRGNMFNMYNVICKYKVLEVDYRIVTAQIKAFEGTVVDIHIFNHFGRDMFATDYGYWKPNIYRLKFKVNQDALLTFDQDKQYLLKKEIVFHDDCETQEHHEPHYKSISWEPQNGGREIANGKQINTTKFYAKANIENTLQLEVCQGTEDASIPFSVYGFSDLSYAEVAHNGKFKTDNLEIEIIEVNGKVFKEAVISDERMPMSVLSFQPLVGVIQ